MQRLSVAKSCVSSWVGCHSDVLITCSLLIYSEAGAIEEEREKEDEEKLCRGGVLDNTQSPMIHTISIDSFANLPILLPLFPFFEVCGEAPATGLSSKVNHQLRLDALQKVDSNALHRHEQFY